VVELSQSQVLAAVSLMRSDCSCILWVERRNGKDRSKPRACQEATIKPGHDAHMCFEAAKKPLYKQGVHK